MCERNFSLNQKITLKDIRNYVPRERSYDIELRQSNYKESGFTEPLKEEVRERDDYSCQVCDEGNLLDVHHIDGDIENNSG